LLFFQNFHTKREFESAINLLNNRPFKQETIKIPEQNLNGVEVLRKEEYVSKSEVKTKEDLKAVAKTGFSLTPPRRAYVIGKTTVDLVDDFKSRNFEKTANNVIDRVVPKGLRKIGVPKKSIGGGSDISVSCKDGIFIPYV
jgi:hypothetical protein